MRRPTHARRVLTLALLLALSGCDMETGGPERTSRLAAEEAATEEAELALSGFGPMPCKHKRVFFDRACREYSFFEPLVAAGSELLIVSGARSKSWGEAVAITETIAGGGVRLVTLSQDKPGLTLAAKRGPYRVLETVEQTFSNPPDAILRVRSEHLRPRPWGGFELLTWTEITYLSPSTYRTCTPDDCHTFSADSWGSFEACERLATVMSMSLGAWAAGAAVLLSELVSPHGFAGLSAEVLLEVLEAPKEWFWDSTASIDMTSPVNQVLWVALMTQAGVLANEIFNECYSTGVAGASVDADTIWN